MRAFCMLAISLLVGALPAVSSAQADRAADCVALVEKAVAFVEEKGKDYALKAFCCSKGPFIDKELYIFALSLDNVMLAHPWKTQLVGQDVDDFQDVHGNHLFKKFREVAETKGSGWVEYWWWLPGEKEQVPKRSFIKRVPGTDVYIGAGYYPEGTRTATR